MILSPTAWPERVVVPLEAGDIDDADAAPPDPLLDRQERFQPFHEPVEVEQLRFRVAMRLLGQARDDLLEVARDVADGDVLLGQLPLKARELLREPFRQRAHGFVLGLLDQLPLAGQQTFDGMDQACLLFLTQRELVPDPVAEIRRRARRLRGAGTARRRPRRLSSGNSWAMAICDARATQSRHVPPGRSRQAG